MADVVLCNHVACNRIRSWMRRTLEEKVKLGKLQQQLGKSLDQAPANLEDIPNMPQGRKCNCHGEYCCKGVKPASLCVCRLEGKVEIRHCDMCKGRAWFEDGECTNCKRRIQSAADTIKNAVESKKEVHQ
jgi:hypothetical protein